MLVSKIFSGLFHTDKPHVYTVEVSMVEKYIADSILRETIEKIVKSYEGYSEPSIEDLCTRLAYELGRAFDTELTVSVGRNPEVKVMYIPELDDGKVLL